MVDISELIAMRPYENPSIVDRMIQELKGISGKLTIIAHQNADPDALGAAFGLASFLREVNSSLNDITIVLEDCTTLTKNILNVTQIEAFPWAVTFERPNNHDLLSSLSHLILVDTSFPQMAGFEPSDILKLREEGLFVGAIDHHSPQIKPGVLSLCINEPCFSAACEIITQLFIQEKLTIQDTIATLLMAGLFFDTRRFELADKWVFQVATILSSQNASFNKILHAFKRKASNPEQIARLKAAQRLRIVPIGPYHIIFSRVSAYEASAARGIIYLGGDLSIVSARRKKELRISIRGNTAFLHQTKIHVGEDIAEPAGSAFGGWGGGHNAAAGINIPSGDVPTRSVEEFMIKRIKEKLGMSYDEGTDE